MFFFTLFYFLKMIFKKKKNIIVLDYENIDEWPSVTQFQEFCNSTSWFQISTENMIE